MDFDEVYKYISSLNIAEKTTLTFKAACLIYWCTENKTWNQRKMRRATEEYNISIWEIGLIIDNLHRNSMIQEYTYLITDSGELTVIELTLAAMVGAGIVVTDKCQTPREFKKVLDLSNFYAEVAKSKENKSPIIGQESEILSDGEAEAILRKQNKPYEFNNRFPDIK